jgi:hypothetical protein
VCPCPHCAHFDANSTPLYLHRQLPNLPEVSMKPSQVPVQCELFTSVPAPPALASLELHHDELVELLSQLLWDVARSLEATENLEASDEQDQH